jgi:transmembrane 9 superfamily member 2/4
VPWDSRWDIYLTNNYYYFDQVHIASIVNSVTILLIMVASMASLISQDLKKSMRPPKCVAKGDAATKEGEDLEICGWRAVSADVFRPPSSSPIFLAVCCGTGAQLLFVVFWTVMSLYLGWLTPMQRGKLFLGALLFYVVCGSINGYVAARLFKTFHCTDRSRALALASVGFPCFVLLLFLILKIIGSSYPPTLAMSWVPISLLLLLIVVGALFVLLGAYIGYRHGEIDIPAATNIIPRPVPKQPWRLGHLFTMFSAGCGAFGVLFMELFFLMRSVWKENYYYTFGFLLIVMAVTILNIMTWVIAFTFFRLQMEDYQWWWRSFFDGGAVAMLAFVFFAVSQLQHLPVNSFSARVIYFGHMGVLSIGLFLMTGFLGVATSLWFNLCLYSVKRSSH